MIRYKIDIIEELRKKGFTTNTARITGTFSQSSMAKFKNGDTTISLDNLNRLCAILGLQPEDIIEYYDTPNEDRFKAYMDKFSKN